MGVVSTLTSLDLKDCIILSFWYNSLFLLNKFPFKFLTDYWCITHGQTAKLCLFNIIIFGNDFFVLVYLAEIDNILN